jgi:hypothetical protein
MRIVPTAISQRVSADVGVRYVEGGDIEQQLILAGVSRWRPSPARTAHCSGHLGWRANRPRPD